VAIYPAVSVGFAPDGLFINGVYIFGDNAFIFLLFLPNRALGSIHHFIGADHPITAQVQETAKS
jgi:hypothetical protein